jgi:hypothetical protein
MTPLETWLSSVSAIFITAIAWLARYIRDMHNKYAIERKENTEMMIKLVDSSLKVVAENTMSNEKMRLTIDNNTTVTAKSADQIERSQDRLIKAMNKDRTKPK